MKTTTLSLIAASLSLALAGCSAKVEAKVGA
jgi:hypothetical protein